MSMPPSAALLLLRELDVVRLCGLEAAARGLDLASRGQVSGGRREGSRLAASVQAEDGGGVTPSIDVPGDAVAGPVRWACSCPAGAAHQAAVAGLDEAIEALACEHVAALLTEWVRHPAEFAVASQERADVATGPSPRRTSAGPAPTRAPRDEPEQPSVDDARRPSSLGQELERLPDEEVAAIARRVLGDDAPEDDDRRVRIARLGAALEQPARPAELLRELESVPVQVLRAIVLLGGAITVAELDGFASRAGLDHGSTAAAVQALRQHGLLFPIPGGAGDPWTARGALQRATTGWRAPAEVAVGIGPALPLVPLALAGANGPPLVSAEPGAQALRRRARIQPGMARQLCSTFALLGHALGPMHPAHRGSRATMPVRSASTGRGQPLPRVPGDPPDAALGRWAQGARVPEGLARMARRVLLWSAEAPSPASALGAALEGVPAAEWPLALQAGFRLWLGADSYAELADLRLVEHGVQACCDPRQPTLRPAALAAENAAARRFLVRLLAQALPGAWYGLDDLVGLAWRLDPFFLRGRQRAFAAPAWWLEDATAGRPLRAGVHDEWQRAEGRYIRALVTGPLHWWGLVDLAGTESDTPQALRVTPLGAYLLGAAPAAPEFSAALASGWGPAAVPASGGALAVQPLACGPALLGALAPWAQVAGVAGGRLLVHISDDLACDSMDAGRDPEAMLATLRGFDRRDGTHNAARWETLVQRWRARYGQTRIERGLVLLEGRDEATLREALASVPGIAARRRFVARHLAVVPAEDLEELERALTRQGFVV